MQAATAVGAFGCATLMLAVHVVQGGSFASLILSPIDFVLVGCDALAVASAYVALAIAPKFITAAEVSLIFLVRDARVATKASQKTACAAPTRRRAMPHAGRA
eukprot:3212660-Prymnesium_polylepis.2